LVAFYPFRDKGRLELEHGVFDLHLYIIVWG